jgi:hypothetical protein
VEIPFTEDQYRALLKLAFLGEWVAHAGKAGMEDDDIGRIEQYVYSFAGKFGATDLIHAEDGMYQPTRVLEDSALPVIEEYDEEGFWDTLIEMLAARDLGIEHGEPGVKALHREEFTDQMEERASVYEEEFEEFGVGRLQIVEE